MIESLHEKTIAAAAAALLCSAPLAADKVKVGFVSTLSGPSSALGIDIRDGFLLAVKLNWAHSGVFWGVFVSETSVGLFTLWLFSKGKWKTVQV